MNLRKTRKLKDLTLTEAGKELGIDAGNLSRIERGKQTPGINLARRIAELYGLTLDQVFANDPGETEDLDDPDERSDRDRTTAAGSGVGGKATCHGKEAGVGTRIQGSDQAASRKDAA